MAKSDWFFLHPPLPVEVVKQVGVLPGRTGVLRTPGATGGSLPVVGDWSKQRTADRTSRQHSSVSFAAVHEDRSPVPSSTPPTVETNRPANDRPANLIVAARKSAFDGGLPAPAGPSAANRPEFGVATLHQA